MSSYVLIIRLSFPVELKIGALGEFDFPSAYYTYAGAGGLSRIKRHFRKEKKLHWHIDYLTEAAKPVEAWLGSLPEIELVKTLEKILDPFIRGFGSSDTRKFSHLFLGKPLPNFLLSEGYRRIK